MTSSNKYESDRVCRNDGTTLRYTRSGRCVECQRAKNERRYVPVENSEKVKAEKNRQDAIFFNWKTYHGRRCVHCMGTERYTSDCSCIECKSELNRHQHAMGYHRLRRHAMKTRLISEMGGKCTYCGELKDTEEMEFHHIDPTTKEKDVGALLGCSYAKVKDEADKCELVCRECHTELHGLNPRYERRY